MAKYKKKPVVVEAFKYGAPWPDWFHDKVTSNDVITHAAYESGSPFERNTGLWCEIKTLGGVMIAKEGDYIIRGVEGELYPCKPDIFEKTYERVDE
ncbi:hypothetical protein ETA57_05175 [Bacillus licheniformis]|uniref:hypothetical protein n=1 Tax=Bacillus licheniformis TaxID=1402 RepID=UPI00084B9293|nr:hypothetical protein [Bacillus licheniformis]AOP14014.1 putative 10.3 kDa protein in GP2-GP6 intergenic region [Bacillus licheniformis]QAW27995.1 hypothetical protein ETA57_05175 [Bacillus licheniformis]